MLNRTKKDIESIIKQIIKNPLLMEIAIEELYQVFVSEEKDIKRSKPQNNSLHLLFKQISDECMEKGIDMRQIVRDEVPIQCTPENIKWLWKLLQEGLFKKKSTTELKRTGEIEVVYDNFNKVLIDRTEGQISLPPFPSEEAE